MKKPIFERVILYARQHRASQGVYETLHRLIDYLKNERLEVLQDRDTACYFDLPLPIVSRDKLSKHDLIVVVGGDGSLLSAARFAVQVQVPVIGIIEVVLDF